MVKVTLVKSPIGEVKAVKETVAALGLKKVRSYNTFDAMTPTLAGQIKRVAHLVRVEEN